MKVAVTVRQVGRLEEQTIVEVLVDVVKPKNAQQYTATFDGRHSCQADTQLAAVLACATQAVGGPWASVSIEAAD